MGMAGPAGPSYRPAAGRRRRQAVASIVVGRLPWLREIAGPFNLLVSLGGGLAAVVLGALLPGDLSARELAAAFIGSVVLQPALEEIFFRGMLQGQLLSIARLRRRYLGISGANAITTVAFALLHLVHRPAATALLVAVPSLVYGYSRERYGGVALPYMQHALHNACLLLSFAFL